MAAPLTAMQLIMALPLPILPDVLAFHVCPFLANRDRANMLQLSRGVRRDLVAKKVSSKVRQFMHLDAVSADEVAAHFAYMREHGTRNLALEFGKDCSLSIPISILDNLRILNITNIEFIYLDGAKPPPKIAMAEMPASLEALTIDDKICHEIFNLDYLPNLKKLEIDRYFAEVTITASKVPQFLCDLNLIPYSLRIARDDAARIMAGPKLTHFSLYTVNGAPRVNEIFDGLDAPELTHFASWGETPDDKHDYDLRAPKLTHVHCDNNGCIPKSAPNITHVESNSSDQLVYAHLTKITNLSMFYGRSPITFLPPSLKRLEITVSIAYVGPIYIQYLPPQLETLCVVLPPTWIYHGRELCLDCATPRSLKEIQITACTVNYLPRDYRGAVIID
jgi:hypothetical protein